MDTKYDNSRQVRLHDKRGMPVSICDAHYQAYQSIELVLVQFKTDIESKISNLSIGGTEFLVIVGAVGCAIISLILAIVCLIKKKQKKAKNISEALRALAMHQQPIMRPMLYPQHGQFTQQDEYNNHGEYAQPHHAQARLATAVRETRF